MSEFKAGASGESEAQWRQFLSYLFAQTSSGIASTGVIAGLGVAQTATASGSVVIGKGAAVVQPSLTAGASPLISNADKTLDVLTGSPMGGLPRNDLIIFNADTAAIEAVIGTPNAAPTDPNVAANHIKLARIRNAASATTIPNSAIDQLQVTTGLGAPGPDTGWLDLPIVVGGFTAPSGARWQARLVGGMVQFRGTLANSAFLGGWTKICNLPAGIPAPPQRVALTLAANTTAVRTAYVETDGGVYVYSSGGSAAWFILGGSYMKD